MSDKKMGRPTENPKPNKVSVRITGEEMEILDKYCALKKVNKAEAIRAGIRSLAEKHGKPSVATPMVEKREASVVTSLKVKK